jgi:hypothetical protein
VTVKEVGILTNSSNWQIVLIRGTSCTSPDSISASHMRHKVSPRPSLNAVTFVFLEFSTTKCVVDFQLGMERIKQGGRKERRKKGRKKGRRLRGLLFSNSSPTLLL